MERFGFAWSSMAYVKWEGNILKRGCEIAQYKGVKELLNQSIEEILATLQDNWKGEREKK